MEIVIFPHCIIITKHNDLKVFACDVDHDNEGYAWIFI
jgi:hypothetical protein